MVVKINTGIGISTRYFNSDFLKNEKMAKKAVEQLNERANKPGQFLNWIGLPEEQLKRVDYIYEMVNNFKNQTKAKVLSVFGIGGSKHPVEHMLGVNGLNIGKKDVLFFSDIDSVSMNRFMQTLDNDITNSNFLVVSKSGTTFEPKDALLRAKSALVESYRGKGLSQKDAEMQASKHFMAVTDKNPATSELRRTADAENWTGKFYIHDDVGGRFSALDDHTLFALAYSGMKKSDMIEMLKGAKKMSDIALTPDFKVNDPLAQATFWATEKANGVKNQVHQYLGDTFQDTVTWHTQMQNESIKDTAKQIAKIPDAMHHSAEAHFNPENRYSFALTSGIEKGNVKENIEGYMTALSESYKKSGSLFHETVDTSDLGLTPETAGALSQSRGFATVYQELVENNLKNVEQPKVLNAVLQPHVESYKNIYKLNPEYTVAGRISVNA